MKFPQNKKDLPGSKAVAMDKALATMQKELPHIFNAVKSLIEFNKACKNLKMNVADTKKCNKLKKDHRDILNVMYTFYKVDKDIIKMFDGLIEKESGE